LHPPSQISNNSCTPPPSLLPPAWLLIMGIFVLLFVPETKGVPIEAIEDELIKKHWFWGKVR